MVDADALVISESPVLRSRIADVLSRGGVKMVFAVAPGGALEFVAKNSFRVALIDLAQPADDPTLGLVAHLSKALPNTRVILFNVCNRCVEEDKTFAPMIYDWFEPTADLGRLVRSVKRAAEHFELARENLELKSRMLFGREASVEQPVSRKGARLSTPFTPESALVGESRVMEEVKRHIAEVASTDITVLLQGESGTGKDVVARVIHSASLLSRNGYLVKVNCPSVPELLLESELFGHEAGAFTGALRSKPGRLEVAANGTAFLDEIGAISKPAQAKLLQVLEHKQFTRLGGTETISVDTRVIAATNAPLETLVLTGEFRPDLYFRLNQYKIEIPPLRQRVEDIPLLVEHLLTKYAPGDDSDGLSMSDGTMAKLMSYSWPGNVRELESAVRRFALTGREEALMSSMTANSEYRHGPGVVETCEASERKTIIAALTQARWNRRIAADILGISYNTLRRRIATYGLDCAVVEPSGVC